jgi:hypothetical protein
LPARWTGEKKACGKDCGHTHASNLMQACLKRHGRPLTSPHTSTQPILVDLPHTLGRAEARRRIADNVHKLASFFPGGASVTHQWQGDRLDLVIAAMGQSVDARLEVEEALVRCHAALPGLLGMLAKPIEAALRAKGSDLLLEDRSKK